jgi:tetratricopeptide (TPR) repeat protein
MSGVRSGSWRFSAQAIGFNAQSGLVDVPSAPASIPPLNIVLRKGTLPPATASAVAAKDLQAQLSLGDQLYDARRWDDAIVVYRAVLANVPLPVAYLRIGEAYRNKGEYDLSIRAYSDLMKRDPSNLKATIGIALGLVGQGDIATAEKMLEAAAQGPGATSEVFYTLGEVKRRLLKLDAAFDAFTLAASLDPTWSRPVFALGQLFLDKGDQDTAVRFFQKVVEIEPASPEGAEAAVILQRLKK